MTNFHIKYTIPSVTMDNFTVLSTIDFTKIKGIVQTKKKKVINNNKFYFLGAVLNGSANGIGNIYKNDRLYFKGRFKNGFPNGTGIIYRNGEKYFEGMFQYGKMTGRGKLYHPNGKLYKSGQFSDGKFTKGILYTFDGKLLYSGSLKNDKYHGKGNLREYKNNRYTEWYTYTGRFFDNKKHGIFLKKEYRDLVGKVVFKGQYKMDSLEGKGTEYKDDGKYEGLYKNNILVKLKHYNKDNKLIYDGQILRDQYHGKGILFDYYNGLFYKGMFENDKKHGKGVERDLNNSNRILRKGLWKNDIFENPISQKERRRRNEELIITQYLQTKDKELLKQVRLSTLRYYSEKYTNKNMIDQTRKKIIKHLEEWKDQNQQSRQDQRQEQSEEIPTVFDLIMYDDVPYTEFLKEKNRVVLVNENNKYFGTYLDQSEIYYECKSGMSYYDYIGNNNVKGILRLSTEGGNYQFLKSDKIAEYLKQGYNLFHFKTLPNDVKALSKDVANGGSIVSGWHCDREHKFKISKITKHQKIGRGLKMEDVDLEF